MIGYAKFVDFKKFKDWMQTDDAVDWYQNLWRETVYKRQKEPVFQSYENVVRGSGFSNLDSDQIGEFNDYLENAGMKWELVNAADYADIKCGSKSFLVPTKFLEIEFLKDYRAVPLQKLVMFTEDSGSGISETMPVPRDNIPESASINDYRAEIEKQQACMEELMDQQKQMEAEMNAELENARREIEKRYAEKTTILEKKKQELNEVKKELENKIYFLDTQIYAIRCFFGETFSLKKLASGKNADPRRTVIMYQKFRYLDEEMGKYTAIYDYDGEYGLFESFLANRMDSWEIFCPEEKCISFVKVSKSGAVYRMSEVYANMVAQYKKFHGGQCAVIIRNGENLYIGWLDEERISLSSSKVFYQPKSGVIVDVNDESKMEKSSTKEDVVSRYFIFSVLQGILKREDILGIPDAKKLGLASRYIKYSVADGSLEEHKYASLSEIIKKYDAPLKVGDMVLTTIRITRDDINRVNGSHMRAFENDRGRGIANRTHDAWIPDCTVQKVNHIDTDYYARILCRNYECDEIKTLSPYNPKIAYINYNRTDRLYGRKPEDQIDYKYENPHMTADMILEQYKRIHKETLCSNFMSGDDRHYWRDPVRVEKMWQENHYFISAVKANSGYHDAPVARANMEFFKDEYINLTFLNSVWITYAIMKQDIGTLLFGGASVDYAHVVRYLNKALEFIKKREEKEKELLLAYVDPDSYPEWPVRLSEWKLANDFHRLHKRNVSSFVRYLKKYVSEECERK